MEGLHRLRGEVHEADRPGLHTLELAATPLTINRGGWKPEAKEQQQNAQARAKSNKQAV
jgi:hypothetical protein